MKIKTEKQGSVAVLTLQGRLDAEASLELREYVDELAEDGTIMLVLGMGELDFVDSSGLGVLVACLRRVAQDGGDLRLADLTIQFKSVLELTRLDRLFKIFDKPNLAVASFQAEGRG